MVFETGSSEVISSYRVHIRGHKTRRTNDDLHGIYTLPVIINSLPLCKFTAPLFNLPENTAPPLFAFNKLRRLIFHFFSLSFSLAKITLTCPYDYERARDRRKMTVDSVIGKRKTTDGVDDENR